MSGVEKVAYKITLCCNWTKRWYNANNDNKEIVQSIKRGDVSILIQLICTLPWHTSMRAVIGESFLLSC